ncbi:MAG: SirB2 family protein [Polaromonas sp.]
MNYLSVKHLHITFAILSGSFFLLRGFWMLADSPLLQRRWVKVVPHGVDTLLLGSALVMVFWSGQYPFVQSWLTAKVLALIAYIVLGAIALKRGKTKGVRTFALLASLAVFAYIVAVALTRQAAIPLQALGLFKLR